jgi:hypothetical protein
MKKTYLLVPIIWGILSSVSIAQLPQDHAYQKTLRNYIATLQENDFEVSLKPLTAEASYFSSTDEIYRAWLFFGYQSADMADGQGLRVGASNFTLGAIESGGQVHMQVGRGEFMNPVATAFWAGWNYPGNPYYDKRAVKLRAFVASAVDMMMQDQDHERGNNDRGDFLGMPLIRWAFAYGVAKDELPQNVRDAYEQGLIRMFEKLEQWGPTGIHADIDMSTMIGVLYAAKFVDSENLTARAHRYIDRLLDKHLAAAGYIDHGGAYDASYNGISLYFVNWAAQLSDYSPLVEALQKMSKLKAYLTLPDPDGQRFSPFHTNPSSGGDAPHDLWSPYFRDVGIAQYSDDGAYLSFDGDRRTIKSETDMLERMNKSLGYFNRYHFDESRDQENPIEQSSPPWKHDHWIDTESLNATAFYYEDGLYERLKSLKDSNSPLTDPPFSREETFTESFADKFLSIKRQTYGTIIFNDRLAWWTGEGQTEELNGFGGGTYRHSGHRKPAPCCWAAAGAPAAPGTTSMSGANGRCTRLVVRQMTGGLSVLGYSAILKHPTN